MSDELKVPSQTADDRTRDGADDRADRDDEFGTPPGDATRGPGDESAGYSPDDPGHPYANDDERDPYPRSDLPKRETAGDGDEADVRHDAYDRDSVDDEDPQSPRTDDEYTTPGTPGSTTVTPGAPEDDAAYRDPYARTGDMLTDPDPDPDPAHTPVAADERPAHAAPDEVSLFDQDPTEVQGRWRDLQAGFVDDPSEAVQRADGLVGEVVESLTSSLTTRTNALRDRWKDAETADTEQLRLALRDYRSVLERLLALSTHQPLSGDRTH
ncbi:hypothetical protein [Nonomuraea sp. NPDC002799]